MARLSVIIPVYNREELLPITLNSLLTQTIPADEIIVVDDGSTDRSAEVAESIDKSIKVIKQENAGPAAARNRGFAESRGEFIHFFDSDDLALPNKHELQIRALESSGADIAYSPWVKGVITESSFRPLDQVYQMKGLPELDLVEALLTHWSVVPHACIFRRDIVEKVCGFPEELFVGEDQYMFLQCLLNDAHVIHVPNTGELYRVGNENKITGDETGKVRRAREWARFLLMAQQACEEYGIDPSRWYAFRYRVWRALEDMREASLMEASMKQLELLLNKNKNLIHFYAEYEFIMRKIMGVKWRLKGTRSHSSFRAAPMDESMFSLVDELIG